MTRINYRLGINLGASPDYVNDITKTVLDIEGVLSEKGYLLNDENLGAFTSFKILDFEHEYSVSSPSGIRIIHRSSIAAEDPDYSLRFRKGTYEGIVGEYSNEVHVLMDFNKIKRRETKNIISKVKDFVDNDKPLIYLK